MPKPTTRKMWMVPRNIRKIEAWKMVQIVQLLDLCTGNITSQQVQDQLYAQLDALGLKVKANEYGVENAGGMRTYFAQLACLGLFWKDDKKQFHTTFAGEELMNGNDPIRILRCQVLRMQYPSVYGLGSNVRIDSSLKVRPFVFIIKLLQDERLGGYLTCLDMAVPVIYGHTHADHETCVTKILKLRETKKLRDVIDSVDDIRTPRRFTEDDEEADFVSGLVDAQNIANTVKNYLTATQLLVANVDNDREFVLNVDPAVQKDIKTWMDVKVETLNPDHKASWQMRFGRYTKTKSIRTRSTQQIDGIQALVRTHFMAAVTAAPYEFNLQAFITDQAKRWGKTEADIGLYLNSVQSKQSNIERDTIKQAAASGGREAIVLEKAATAIFKKLGFDLSEHLGQTPSPSNRQGGYPDIRLRATGLPECGFADTKATMNYGFQLGDTIKLETYYKDCWNEFPDQTPSSFFVYIAGGFGKTSKTVESLLAKCATGHGRPVSALTVDALLELVEMENPPTPATLMTAFKKGAYYTTGVGVASAVP